MVLSLPSPVQSVLIAVFSNEGSFSAFPRADKAYQGNSRLNLTLSRRPLRHFVNRERLVIVLSPQFSPQHLRRYTELCRFALSIRRWTGVNISPCVASPS